MLIIWKALITYLDQNLRAGRGIALKNFGAFTFDIQTELPKIARPRGRSIGRYDNLETERAERKKVHHLRFVLISL